MPSGRGGDQGLAPTNDDTGLWAEEARGDEVVAVADAAIEPAIAIRTIHLPNPPGVILPY
jgi:hypothetical protein